MVTNDAGQVIIKKKCRIQVPVRFTETAVGLGRIGVDTAIYGLFILTLESGEYSICNMTGLVQINPTRQQIITVDDTDYVEFSFDANQVVFKTLNIIKNDDLIYNVLREVVLQGKVPWYIDYEDLGKMYDTAEKHAKSTVGNPSESMEMIISIIARRKDDLSKYFRTGVKDGKMGKPNLDWVPLKSVFHSVNNTVSKFTGSYFSDGITSALVDPSTKTSPVEEILRK